MKAFKGCVNRECKAYKSKIHYKDNYDFCPQCGEKVEYVCAECWKVLDHNDKKYCIGCETRRAEKREQNIKKVKSVGAVVVSAGAAAWKKKDKIIDITKTAIKVIKK